MQKYILFLMILLIFMISMILFLLNLLISKKEFLLYEKMSSFECGFFSMNSSHLPFSINFYIIAILFLIFDVEVIFLFPFMNLFNFLNFEEWLFTNFFILLILYMGLEFEKKEGSLKWMF